jgi:phage internal scaffolding protein
MTAKITFRTAYDGLQKNFSDLTATDFSVPEDDADYHPSRSLTSQSDASELDINNIMARYLKTGLVPMSRATPFWGDASALPDYQEAQNIIVEAKTIFDSLPAKLRDRFHNSPEEFLAFMGDEKNAKEAEFLGIVTPIQPDPEAERPQTAGKAKGSPEAPEPQE